MADSTPPIHRRLAEIGRRIGGPFGFALAGGHAIAAHGILERPSEDVDLFADWQRRADFPPPCRYTLDRLCELAYDADSGFDRQLFAAMLGRIDRLDDDFIVYGASRGTGGGAASAGQRLAYQPCPRLTLSWRIWHGRRPVQYGHDGDDR